MIPPTWPHDSLERRAQLVGLDRTLSRVYDLHRVYAALSQPYARPS
jgi:hypothetical protein